MILENHTFEGGNFRMEKRFLSDSILKRYSNLKAPMTELGEFVYTRTYSRWLPEQGRRETWLETITRTIEYNIGLELEFFEENQPWLNLETAKKKLEKEAEELLENMFYLRQFASGRTMWVANTPVSREYPLSNFNCSFMALDNFQAFAEMFYLLMLGSGTGFRTMPYDVEKMPAYRVGIKTSVKEFTPVPVKERLEHTNLLIIENRATIVVGDSKQGWVSALDMYFQLRTHFLYKEITEIEFNFDSVRPKGELLKKFGGRASGHESIQIMFMKIDAVMERAGGKLRPVDVLDIGNIIAENVVSGGVRRSSQINLASKDEMEIENAKNGMYVQNSAGEWVEDKAISHRRMSNNSIFYEDKPTRPELSQNIKNMRYTGERGFVNAKVARKRRKNFHGLNPCAEILLDSQQVCNLTTNNMLAFVKNGKLQKSMLLRAFALSTRIGIRMTLPKLEIEAWAVKQERDRLIGVSMTGWFDMVDAVGLSIEEQAKLLRQLKRTVRKTAKEYCGELGIPEPLLATTVKPEGTISQLPTVSSGIHRSHSPFFIRRVRVTYSDPLAKVAMKLGWPVHPETGQTWENCDTVVVEFPVKSPVKKTKYDVTAIEQLETYKMFQECYTEHNTSITVTVREHEWEGVEQWIWDNWDCFVAVSFLPLDDAHYPLAPYEAITEEEYTQRKAKMKPFDHSLLSRYEVGEDLDVGDTECVGGACPIR